MLTWESWRVPGKGMLTRGGRGGGGVVTGTATSEWHASIVLSSIRHVMLTLSVRNRSDTEALAEPNHRVVPADACS